MSLIHDVNTFNIVNYKVLKIFFNNYIDMLVCSKH